MTGCIHTTKNCISRAGERRKARPAKLSDARSSLCSSDSRFESVGSSVETVVAVAQIGALDSREEALAVFLGTVGLLAVASALEPQLRLLSPDKL